jgi:hypothetical protein
VPAETRPPRWNAHEAVANVLAGKTADGSGMLPLAIPFTKDPQARAAAAEVVATLSQQLNGALTDEAATSLAAKLLAHFCKTGRQTAEAIRAFPAAALADAIREAPEHQRGDIDASSATEVSLPMHQSGNIDASSATEVSLPMHQSGYVHARSAKEVSLPMHQNGDVDARLATEVSLPMHQSGYVDAPLSRNFINRDSLIECRSYPLR